MNKAVTTRILRETCSHSLFAAIEKAEAELSDFDLLALALRFSRDVRTRLELLQLIEIKTASEFVQARAARSLAYEKSKLERFSLDEDNCYYRLWISIRPNLPKVVYLARTYAGVLKAVADYYEQEPLEFDDSSRFTVTKLVADKSILPVLKSISKAGYKKENAANDNDKAEQAGAENSAEQARAGDFAGQRADAGGYSEFRSAGGHPKGFEKTSFEDAYADVPKEFQGEARFKGDFLLTDIVHVDLRDNTVLATDMGCIDQDCKTCKTKPCLLFYAIKIPVFLSDFDLAYYFNHEGERIFGMVLVSLKTGIEDECAFFIPLFGLDESKLDTREGFLQFEREAHTFIEYPLLERCEASDAPQEIWDNLEIYKRLHKRFRTA